MEDSFKTIGSGGEGYYSEKRSKFLAFTHHVESTDEVKEIVAGYRKKYFDARHVCYAYMLGADRKDFRANDDGEPSSTAGKPILGQINSNDLAETLIVVVRYYGGVNLGTGGLIVAYRVLVVLGADGTVLHIQDSSYLEEGSGYDKQKVMRVVKETQARIVSQNFDNTCSISLSIRQSQAEQLRSRLEKLSFE